MKLVGIFLPEKRTGQQNACWPKWLFYQVCYLFNKPVGFLKREVIVMHLQVVADQIIQQSTDFILVQFEADLVATFEGKTNQ